MCVLHNGNNVKLPSIKGTKPRPSDPRFRCFSLHKSTGEGRVGLRVPQKRGRLRGIKGRRQRHSPRLCAHLCVEGVAGPGRKAMARPKHACQGLLKRHHGTMVGACTDRVIAVVVVAHQPELEHVVRRVAVHQVLQRPGQHDGHGAAVDVPDREVASVVRLRDSLGESQHCRCELGEDGRAILTVPPGKRAISLVWSGSGKAGPWQGHSYARAR